jgi:CheY-like chemotaxis protein
MRSTVFVTNGVIPLNHLVERGMNDRDANETTAASGKAAGKIGVTVLHVDDDPNDTALFQAACRKAELEFALHNVEDGEQAMAYLQNAEKTSGQIPSIVLLDLKMPRATGFELLRWIRKHPSFSTLPVIVLSGSELQQDIKDAYAQGANSYLVKPLGFDSLVELIKNISDAWLNPTSKKVS